LKSYSSEKYAVSVDKMKKLTDDLAKQASPAMRQKMLLAYLRASQLEWHFWEGAYALGRKF
jgi:thiaminase/transcriptional activator TenA